MKKQIDEYFYRIVDQDLLKNLDLWKIKRIQIMLEKAYKKGKKEGKLNQQKTCPHHISRRR